MLGVTVNVLSVIIGSTLGIIIKNGLSDDIKTIISQAVGLTALYIGASSAISRMILPEAHPLLFILSLVIGGAIGQWIDIEKRLNNFAVSVDNKLGEGSQAAKGFMVASLIFCVGTMAVIGSLESGISGNHQTLFAKSVMDGVTSVVLAATYGIGVMFSAAAVFAYQGGIAILAKKIAPFLTQDMIREISIVGGILISCIGLDLLDIKKIKVENMLPALFVPVFYYLLALNLNF